MQSFVSQCKVTIYNAKEKHDQRKIKTTGNFKEDQDRLNLQKLSDPLKRNENKKQKYSE